MDDPEVRKDIASWIVKMKFSFGETCRPSYSVSDCPTSWRSVHTGNKSTQSCWCWEGKNQRAETR